MKAWVVLRVFAVATVLVVAAAALQRFHVWSAEAFSAFLAKIAN